KSIFGSRLTDQGDAYFRGLNAAAKTNPEIVVEVFKNLSADKKTHFLQMLRGVNEEDKKYLAVALLEFFAKNNRNGRPAQKVIQLENSFSDTYRKQLEQLKIEQGVRACLKEADPKEIADLLSKYQSEQQVKMAPIIYRKLPNNQQDNFLEARGLV